MGFYEFWMGFLSKYPVHVSKKWKPIIFDRKSENLTFISIDKKPSKMTSKIWVNLEGFLLVVREKRKNETDATFLDVYDVFASKKGHFSHLA